MSEMEQNMEPQKALLAVDALSAKKNKCSPAWLDATQWDHYTVREIRAPLYHSFSDEELLDMIRREAEELGRLPCKKDIFCVYREFIIWRFKNWPSALEAAGLRASRAERHAGFREAEERRLREKKREKKRLKTERVQAQREAEARKKAREEQA